MSFGDKLQGFASSAEQGVKTTSMRALHLSTRVITGVVLGLTLGLIGQELVGYGIFVLLFVIAVVLTLVVRNLANWSIGKILIFDLFCVLVAMLLRMYILVAP